MSTIALGTANFGLPYGILRRDEAKLSGERIASILDRATLRGIDTLDTALAYGDAHSVISRHARRRFRIISKCPAGREQDAAQLAAQSARELGVERLDGWLLHDADALLTPGVAAQLVAARAHARRVGVSAYYPEQLERALVAGAPLDLVQIPLNVLDQRFLPLLPQLHERGIAVHARSALLQGTLVAPLDRLPAAVEPARPNIERFDREARARGMTRTRLALAFVSAAGVERIVAGVEDAAQVDEDCDGAATEIERMRDFAALAIHDLDVIVPSRWAS